MAAGEPERTQELQPGERLGPFLLESVLGEGAMGVVFRAVRDPGGQRVALKVLKRQLSEDATYVRRFVHEGRAASEVQSSHLVPIIGAGEADGRTYLAVAYIDGPSLADRIKAEGHLPLDDTIRITADVAAGLDALHRAGLVHRDVKPANILLDRGGRALLTDFGLAKGPAYTVLTRPGQIMGTLDYLAPELIKGEPATPASDIYALGCAVYVCLAGRAPFADRSVYQVPAAIVQDEPSDPVSDRDDAPDGLGWAALRALAKDPAERPPTATAYANMLRVGTRA